MIQYNFDFLIAALVILGLLAIHYHKVQRLDTRNSRFFRLFLIFGISDVAADIVTSVMIMHPSPKWMMMTKVAVTIFFILQAMVADVFLCYVQSLQKNRPGNDIARDMKIGAIPAISMVVLILINFGSGFIFYFDEQGVYCKGPLYYSMYALLLFYMFIGAVCSYTERKYFTKDAIVAIWQMITVALISGGIQAIFTGTLITGFGIAMCIVILYFGVNHPSAHMDTVTDTFDKVNLTQWIKEQKEFDKELHFIAADLSYLRQINQFYGNAEGDAFLKETALYLMELVGKHGHVFRITGKRFLIVVNKVPVFEQLLGELKEYFEKDKERHAMASTTLPVLLVGVKDGHLVGDSDTILEYLEYLVADNHPHEETKVLMADARNLEGFHYDQTVEAFLNAAIEGDLFEVNYQPIYSLEDQKYYSLEALSRLRHPVLGYIAPDKFISIAEKTGQLSVLGELQFRKVCRFIKDHEEMMKHINNVKFNLSPSELLKAGHSEKLIEIIDEYGLSPSYFQFEITETVATRYCKELYTTVKDFTDSGIALCLDDFGAGFANLNAVMKMPFSVIKLDRSLLMGLCVDEQVASFYRNIVEVLHTLKYRVVAEGVETTEELELLKEYQVDLVQGYYFSKPLPEQEILRLIRANLTV